jgi:hypothetical protein
MYYFTRNASRVQPVRPKGRLCHADGIVDTVSGSGARSHSSAMLASWTSSCQKHQAKLTIGLKRVSKCNPARQREGNQRVSEQRGQLHHANPFPPQPPRTLLALHEVPGIKWIFVFPTPTSTHALRSSFVPFTSSSSVLSPPPPSHSPWRCCSSHRSTCSFSYVRA